LRPGTIGPKINVMLRASIFFLVIEFALAGAKAAERLKDRERSPPQSSREDRVSGGLPSPLNGD